MKLRNGLDPPLLQEVAGLLPNPRDDADREGCQELGHQRRRDDRQAVWLQEVRGYLRGGLVRGDTYGASEALCGDLSLYLQRERLRLFDSSDPGTHVEESLVYP